MCDEPVFDRRSLVGGVVVADEMQVEIFGGVLVDGLEEAQELLVTVAAPAAPARCGPAPASATSRPPPRPSPCPAGRDTARVPTGRPRSASSAVRRPQGFAETHTMRDVVESRGAEGRRARRAGPVGRIPPPAPARRWLAYATTPDGRPVRLEFVDDRGTVGNKDAVIVAREPRTTTSRA
jgi:hypothetical protein